jgi:hypothetical protein
MIYIISIGIALLLGFLFILWWVMRAKEPASMPVYDSRQAVITGSEVEYKLRNAIYEVEQQVLACEDEIETLCKYQLELLRDVGKPSFMQIANKPLFFKYENPLRKEDRYYYVADLDDDWEEDEDDEDNLAKRKTALENYNVHIQLYRAKWLFFKNLLHSHQENLARLENTEEGKRQISTLRKVQQLQMQQQQMQQQTRMEVVAIKSEHLLEEIGKELDFQEEYLRQYTALDAEYSNQPNIDAYQIYQRKLDSIIEKIQAHDPIKHKK